MPTAPITYQRFIQLDPRTGQWKQYDFRDHVNEHQDYFGLASDGTLRRFTGVSTADPSRFDKDANQTNSGDTSVLGAAARVGFDAIFRSGAIKPPNPFNGDPLAGDPSKGESVTDPKILAAARQLLKDTWGLGGSAVTNDTALNTLATAIQVAAGLIPGENFDEAMFAHYSKQGIAATDFLNLYTPTKARNVEGVLAKSGAAVNMNAPDQETDAGRGAPQDFAGFSGGADTASPTQPSSAKPGGATSVIGGSGTEPGVGGALGQTQVQVPQEAGPGPGGAVISPDELQNFINSDWHLPFNAMLNHFRNAGAASMFMDWLSTQGNRLIGEFEGQIAQQAMNGEVPTGEFSSYLARKGLLPGTGLVPGATSGGGTSSLFASSGGSSSPAGGSSGTASGSSGSPAAAAAQGQATPPLQVTPPASQPATVGGGTKSISKDYVSGILGI